MSIYLLDKSATAARHEDKARARLENLIVQGRLAICQITALEILYSAQSLTDYERGAGALKAYRWLDTTTECLARAMEVQHLLARTGRHRVPIPDLLIAATAEHHKVTVLHVDRDYDVIAEVTEQPVERLV